MDDLEERSDETIFVSTTEATGRQGLKMDVKRGYVPPLDGRDDLHHAFDMQIARGVAEVLVKKYFGYPWLVEADAQQGIVKFKIPDLMGATLWYVIKLGDFGDLTPELIIRCGGETLERMGLPRGQIDMAVYANARDNKHKFDFADVKH